MSEDLTELYRMHVASLAERTGQVLDNAGYDAVALHSGSLVKRSVFDDQFWPLRPVPHFQHWAHLEWPECALLFKAGKKPILLALRDKSFWERPREPDWKQLSAALDVVEVSTAAEIKERVLGHGKVAFVGENLARAADWGIDDTHGNPAGLMPGLDELRVFKTQYEIECLARANALAAKGHRAVKDAFGAGERSELNLHLAYLGATRLDDWETPYKNIVALGASAAILHHVSYARGPKAARSLLLDAGASCQGYASDVTRTYAEDGEDAAASLFSELIRRMEILQLALVDGVRVGRPYETLHDEAHLRLAGVLADTGVVQMSAEECVQTGISRKFLPHGLGHSLGLQCHDVGCAKVKPRDENAWLRNTRVIEAGQVFTIEPGVYFIDTFLDELRGGPHQSKVDWAKVEALRPFGGIRIEDDVVVLPDGEVTTSQNLTRATL